jgi:hypothetical protein
MSEALKESSTLTVRVDPELLVRFRVVCLRERVSMSDKIREFIEWYADKKEGG